jgi:hypothetical protein
MKILGASQFGNIIIENLKKAGVQNTIKNGIEGEREGISLFTQKTMQDGGGNGNRNQ